MRSALEGALEVYQRLLFAEWLAAVGDGCLSHPYCSSLAKISVVGVKCSHQFCWECLVDYKEIIRTDNTAHNIDCQFHTDNLP